MKDTIETVISRWRYRRACERDLRQATASAIHAEAAGDYRTQARMLNRAMMLSTKIAKAYGVAVKGEPTLSERDSESVRIAHDVIETTKRARGRSR